MAKGKSKQSEAATEDPIIQDERQIDVIEGALKDDFCNYIYEVLQGVGKGARHKVEGPGLAKDTLIEAFKKFNVHLAVIDGAFKFSEIEIDDVDKFHNHELVALYNVTGFKISGTSETESIVLIGTKYCDVVAGRMDGKWPKVPLDNLSHYKWYNELKAAADEVRRLITKYHEGDFIPVAEDEEEKPDPKQGKLFDLKLKGVKGKVSVITEDVDFEGAEV